VEVLERAVRNGCPILQLAIAPFPVRPVEGCEDALAVGANAGRVYLDGDTPGGWHAREAAGSGSRSSTITMYCP
jgi:hypothetical protein